MVMVVSALGMVTFFHFLSLFSTVVSCDRFCEMPSPPLLFYYYLLSLYLSVKCHHPHYFFTTFSFSLSLSLSHHTHTNQGHHKPKILNISLKNYKYNSNPHHGQILRQQHSILKKWKKNLK